MKLDLLESTLTGEVVINFFEYCIQSYAHDLKEQNHFARRFSMTNRNPETKCEFGQINYRENPKEFVNWTVNFMIKNIDNLIDSETNNNHYYFPDFREVTRPTKAQLKSFLYQNWKHIDFDKLAPIKSIKAVLNEFFFEDHFNDSKELLILSMKYKDFSGSELEPFINMDCFTEEERFDLLYNIAKYQTLDASFLNKNFLKFKVNSYYKTQQIFEMIDFMQNIFGCSYYVMQEIRRLSKHR